jgi:transcriptional regulator with XRE-family HTH domain
LYLKEFREYLELTQKAMSEKLNMTQTALARYELGKVNPSVSVIQKYIDEFGASPNFLFNGIKPFILDDFHNIDADNMQLLNELGFLMDKNDINKFLKELILKQIIEKFNNIEVSLFVKFLSFLGTERPLLFLYYIIQIIDYNNLNNKNTISTNYVEYLCLIIEKFPVWKFFINQPVFTKRIQNKFIEIIRTKLNEQECKLIVTNSQNVLKLLEIKLPSYIISTHKLKSSQLEQCLLTK